MNKKQIDLLGEYIKFGQIPVLLEKIPESVIQKGAIVIEANCSIAELQGDFDNYGYVPPKWYTELIEGAKSHTPVLIIRDINKVSLKEQRKFIELLKYRKVYTNKVPDNCRIFATYINLEKNPIDEEVYSCMAHI